MKVDIKSVVIGLIIGLIIGVLIGVVVKGNNSSVISSDTDYVSEDSGSDEGEVFDKVTLNKDSVGTVIYDKDNIKVIVDSFEYANGKDIYVVNFRIENNSKIETAVDLWDVSINNFEVSTYDGTPISAGKKGICDVGIYVEEYKESSPWTEIECNAKLSDFDTWDVYATIPLVINKSCWE